MLRCLLFQVLVEKEWLDFGHKMGDRCGNAFSTSDLNERSPIFLQWLDCVHQLLLQFPCHFEFNLSFLVKLASHTYSSLFGTFLCNSASERKEHRVYEQTRSVWNFLKHHPHKFCNLLYIPPSTTSSVYDESDVLWPRSEVRDMLVWTDVYMSEQRQGGNSNGQTNLGARSREGTSKVRSSSANGLTQGLSQQRNGRSGCISSDQIDSGTASSRDGSEILDGELKSHDIIEELEKLHVGSSSIPISSSSDKVPKVCYSHELSLTSQNPTTRGQTINHKDGPSKAINRTVEAVSDIMNKSKNIGGINERSTDTLVPECDIEERSSRLHSIAVGGQHCDQSDGIQESSTVSPSKETIQTELDISPNNLNVKKHCQLHQNTSQIHSSGPGTQNAVASPCSNPMNATCFSSDDFSTEDEDGIVNGLDTAYSSRHYTSSQNSTNSQNMLLELESSCSLYDSDGLLSHNNGVQRRLVSIFSAHKKQVNHLKRDLYLTRMALCRSKLANHNHHRSASTNASNASNGAMDGHGNLANGGKHGVNGHGLTANGNGVNGGNHSNGCASSVQSDASSWEAVDEKETKPTLWVPDHAVSSCMRYA